MVDVEILNAVEEIMTTHGIVGVYDDPGKAAWRAIPIGCDAYPSGTGFTLHLSYYHLFERQTGMPRLFSARITAKKA